MSDLKELLDKIYELEGLVHLALKRDEAMNDFLRLISKKGTEVCELCKALSSDNNSDKKEDINSEQEKTMRTSDPLPFQETFQLDEYSIDDDPETSKEPELLWTDDKTEPVSIPPFPADMESPRGKLVFSINERFRFRKELFENSDADFNNTLALVASMENFEEAEDYFINEEGFDYSKPVVKEFMEVIKRYFS